MVRMGKWGLKERKGDKKRVKVIKVVKRGIERGEKGTERKGNMERGENGERKKETGYSKRCGGEKSGVLWELTLKTAGSGTGVSGTADSDKCSPAVSCTRSSDPHPPRCHPRLNVDETCGTSPAVIPALLPSPVLDSL